MIRTLGNAVLFQLGWWVAILSAGRGQPWLAPVVLAGLITVNIWNASQPRAMTLVVLSIGSAGLLLDSGLTALALLRFEAHPFAPWLCPPWLCALWYLFATTLHQSLRWLEGRTWLAALIGGIAGPVSYGAGEVLGALTLGSGRNSALLLLALVWAGLLPLFVRIAEHLYGAAAGSRQD
ncbi:MAG: DUF2878 family protein [Nitrospira sp. CR2.1]|nr:DUF2878 family protein [Nitrospira sp. CR2.1]